MSKSEELHDLGVQQTQEEKALEDSYYKTHTRPQGRVCIEIPGMKEIRERYRQRYFEILKKYENVHESN